MAQIATSLRCVGACKTVKLRACASTFLHPTRSAPQLPSISLARDAASKRLITTYATSRDAPLSERVQQLKPAGWTGWLAWRALAFPIWITSLVVPLLLTFLRNPFSFFDKRVPDTSSRLEKEWQHEYVTANGVRLHTVSPGRRPGKQLMLFLHGFPETWYSWRHQMREFADDYDVVAIDMRGYGQSDKPQGREHYFMDTLAADVAGVIPALGHQSCVLVAHDWGGAVAWLVAALYPELVQRHVSIAGPHLGAWIANTDLHTTLSRSWYILAFQCRFLPELLLTNNAAMGLGRLFTKSVKREGAFTQEDVDVFRANLVQPGVATAILNYYRALFDVLTVRPKPEVWRAIRAVQRTPTLVLWADSDTALAPKLVDGLPDLIKGAQVHFMRNCSHWVQQDQPDETNKLMREFLAGTA